MNAFPDDSAEIPDLVADIEVLARHCSRSAVRADGVVKRQAFLSTRKALEISVDRVDYCDTWGRCPENKVIAFVRTEQVRGEIPRAAVEARKLPDHPAHAQIELRPGGVGPGSVERKEDLPSLGLQSEYEELATSLAQIAIARLRRGQIPKGTDFPPPRSP